MILDLEVEKKIDYNCLVSVLLPAKNEAQTIYRCIETYRSHLRVGEVIVIANGCDDDTAMIARNSEARVFEVAQDGKGNALMLGAKNALYPILVCIDSDTPNPQLSTITKLLNAFPSNQKIVKGTFDREFHPGPVTDMLLKPILKTSGHPLAKLSQPLSGVFACGKEWFCSLNLPNGFGVDLEIILTAIKMGIDICEVNIDIFEHKHRDWKHYIEMSNEISKVLLDHGFLNSFSKKNY